MNNLTYKGKHFDGKFTFYKGKNKSQNDIVLANSKALNKMTSFCIHEISFNPSNHFPVIVTCTLRMLLIAAYSVQRKINPADINWDNYKEIATHELESGLEVSQPPSQNLLVSINIDNLSRVLLNTAKTCTIPRVHAMTIDVNLPSRNLLERSDQALTSFLTGATGVEDWHAARSLVIYENKKAHFGKIAER